MIERTLAIIKPDAVAAGKTGEIIGVIEKNGFIVERMSKCVLSQDRAHLFYHMHEGKPFFDELVDFMCSGPVVVLVLAKDHAISAWRVLMGDTNPSKAADGSIRKRYGTSIGHNAVHGSDSPESARREIVIMFSEKN